MWSVITSASYAYRQHQCGMQMRSHLTCQYIQLAICRDTSHQMKCQMTPQCADHECQLCTASSCKTGDAELVQTGHINLARHVLLDWQPWHLPALESRRQGYKISPKIFLVVEFLRRVAEASPDVAQVLASYAWAPSWRAPQTAVPTAWVSWPG